MKMERLFWQGVLVVCLLVCQAAGENDSSHADKRIADAGNYQTADDTARNRELFFTSRYEIKRRIGGSGQDINGGDRANARNSNGGTEEEPKTDRNTARTQNNRPIRAGLRNGSQTAATGVNATTSRPTAAVALDNAPGSRDSPEVSASATRPPWRPFRSNPAVSTRPGPGLGPNRAGTRNPLPTFGGYIPDFIIRRRNAIIRQRGRFQPARVSSATAGAPPSSTETLDDTVASGEITISSATSTATPLDIGGTFGPITPGTDTNPPDQPDIGGPFTPVDGSGGVATTLPGSATDTPMTETPLPAVTVAPTVASTAAAAVTVAPTVAATTSVVTTAPTVAATAATGVTIAPTVAATSSVITTARTSESMAAAGATAPTKTAQCTANPQDIQVGIDIQLDFEDDLFAACVEEDKALVLQTIQTTLNAAFPTIVTDWQGTAKFGPIQLDEQELVDNDDTFGGFRRFQSTQILLQAPRARRSDSMPDLSQFNPISTSNVPANTANDPHPSPPRPSARSPRVAQPQLRQYMPSRSSQLEYFIPSQYQADFIPSQTTQAEGSTTIPAHHQSHPNTRQVGGQHRRRKLQLESTCPDRPMNCPETADACLFGCGTATTTNCGSGSTDSWANLGGEISTALGALNLDCMGTPNVPVVVVHVFE